MKRLRKYNEKFQVIESVLIYLEYKQLSLNWVFLNFITIIFMKHFIRTNYGEVHGITFIVFYCLVLYVISYRLGVLVFLSLLESVLSLYG